MVRGARGVASDQRAITHLASPVHEGDPGLGYPGCIVVPSSDVCSADKIVVGSFQGLVRIYLPRPQEYHPDHLILERDMGAPVLQVAVGRFVQ